MKEDEEFFFEGEIENDEDVQQAEAIKQLQSEISYIQSMIRVPQSIRGAVILSAFGYLAGKNMAGNDQTAKMILAGLGGLAGMRLGAGKELTNGQKSKYQEILTAKQKELGSLKNKYYSDSESVLSSAQVRNYDYEKHNLGSPWVEFIGMPSRNFHALVSGKPKGGKSTMCIKLADYLSRFGRVLYIAAEEGFSATLQQKINDFSTEDSQVDFANFREYDPIKSAVRGYDFVFIDSVNKAKITVDELEEIKKKNPQTAFITILQSTKDGNFRGSQEFGHDCDIIIKVDNGIATQQGRFHAESEMIIFNPKEGPGSENEDHQATEVTPKRKGRPPLDPKERQRRVDARERARRTGGKPGRPSTRDIIDQKDESDGLFSRDQMD